MPEQYGGFPDKVLSASAEAWNDNYAVPHEMTEEQIWEVIEAFGAAAKRAVKAGIKIIAVHGAHGYLIHSFASPTVCLELYCARLPSLLTVCEEQQTIGQMGWLVRKPNSIWH